MKHPDGHPRPQEVRVFQECETKENLNLSVNAAGMIGARSDAFNETLKKWLKEKEDEANMARPTRRINLEYVDVSNNPRMDHEGLLSALSRYVPAELHLSSTGLSDDGARLLGDYLDNSVTAHKHRPLKMLDVSENALGDEGVARILDAVAWPGTFEATSRP